MYRIKVIIDTSAEKLIAAFENSDDITKWKTTLSKHQILKKFDKFISQSFAFVLICSKGFVKLGY